MSASTNEPTAAVFTISAVQGARVTCPAALSSRVKVTGHAADVTFIKGDAFAVEINLAGMAAQQICLRITDAAVARALSRALRHAATGTEHFLKRASPLPSAPASRRGPPSRSCSTTPERGPAAPDAGGNSPRSEATGVIPSSANGTNPDKTPTAESR